MSGFVFRVSGLVFVRWALVEPPRNMWRAYVVGTLPTRSACQKLYLGPQGGHPAPGQVTRGRLYAITVMCGKHM